MDEQSDGLMRSKCCQSVCTDEPIYLLTKSGRKEIARVPVCCAFTCRKVCGSPMRLKGGKEITDADWSKMLAFKRNPPFYFEKKEHGLEPEGYKPPEVKSVGRDLAANDIIDDSIEEVPF